MLHLPSCSIRSSYIKKLPIGTLFTDPKNKYAYEVVEKQVVSSLIKCAVNYLGNELPIQLENVPSEMFKIENPSKANPSKLLKNKINSLEDKCELHLNSKCEFNSFPKTQQLMNAQSNDSNSMTVCNLDDVIKSDFSDNASRHSNSYDDVTIISGRRSIALIIEDSDGTDYEMYNGYHLTNSRDVSMETLVNPSSSSFNDDDSDLSQRQELRVPKRNYPNEMPSVSMDIDELVSNYSPSVDETCDSDESETSSIVSSLDEVDISNFSDDDEEPTVKQVLSPTTARISAQNSIGKDDRPFAQFMEEEGLIEVVRDWKKYPTGSKVDIKTGGALWIAEEKTHVIISKATQDLMKQEGIWGKILTIGNNGYVFVGKGYGSSLHVKLAKFKKDAEFLKLREVGWIGEKAELEILHLDDCPYNFNIGNLSWNTHGVNLLLKLSKGTPNKKKYHCSTNINGKSEHSTSCDTLLEARHAVDILKINNVDPIHQKFVFKHGLNFTYPCLKIILSRTTTYKSKPTHQGKAFKSAGIITLLDWKFVDAGLKKAVEDTKVPFDTNQDVLVKYVGKKGNGASLMFVMEDVCYRKHIVDQEVTLSLSKGWVNIKKQNYYNGVHRLVLGLETGYFKLARHRIGGVDGRRDNRLRLLRPGNHASNMRDKSMKTGSSSSKFDGVSWVKHNQKWMASIRFSNKLFKFDKYLGLFGKKGDKSTGEKEASEWRTKVCEHAERINEELKDVMDRAEFIRKINEEIKKLL